MRRAGKGGDTLWYRPSFCWRPKRLVLVLLGSTLTALLIMVCLTPVRFPVRPCNPADYTRNLSFAENNDYRQNNSEFYKAIHSVPDCKPNTKLMVMVITSPQNGEMRQTYRNTVLSRLGEDTQYAFLIGRSSSETEAQIYGELTQFNDMIVGNFQDSYENLTIKSLFALKWISDHCPQTRHMLKVDDDVYANVPAITNYLRTINTEQPSVFGVLFTKVIPISKSSNKWHADAFYLSKYGCGLPTYVSGPAYIIDTEITRPLFNVGMEAHFLRLEDAFITGVCVENLRQHGYNIQHIDMIKLQRYEPLNSIDDVSTNLLTVHGLDKNALTEFWKKIFIVK